jgi:ABC-type multidrug transport system permease subunit
MYWLDPFTYLVQGLLTPVTWDVIVQCKPEELTYIPLQSNTTCGEYIGNFLTDNAGYVVDEGNTTMCAYCQYSTGADFLRTMNIKEQYYGWRSVSIFSSMKTLNADV